MQKNRFNYCEIQTWKSILIWRLDLEKTISLGVLWENSEQFLWEDSEQFYLMQKIDLMNTVSKYEYIVNMMYREQILLM